MTDKTAPATKPTEGKRKQPWWVWVLVAVVAVVIIANIPSGDDDSDAAAETTTATASEAPVTDEPASEEPASEEPAEPAAPEVTTDDVLAYLESSTGGHMFKEMCTSVGYDGWQCWYDSLEIDGNMLRAHITTDGGRTNAELDEMADQAARWFRNFLSSEFDFSWYIANVNGVDLANMQPL